MKEKEKYSSSVKCPNCEHFNSDGTHEYCLKCSYYLQEVKEARLPLP